MANGGSGSGLTPAQKCCLVCVCCDCPELAKKVQAMRDGMLADLDISEDHADKVSNWILSNFDLVPKGLGKAITDAYRPMFELDNKLKSEGVRKE